jgi:hypothetical protein
MWDFFRFKNNEKGKDTEKISKDEVKKNTAEDIDDESNEYTKNIFSIVDFPEKINQINKAYPLLKEKEKVVLNQILDSLKKRRKKDSKHYFNELNKIRKDLSILETSKKVMEHTSIKISLIHDISDTLDVLDPILNEQKEEKENNGNEGKNDNKEEMNTFKKTLTENIIRNNYKEIDIDSIDEIDTVFKKVMSEKESHS